MTDTQDSRRTVWWECTWQRGSLFVVVFIFFPFCCCFLTDSRSVRASGLADEESDRKFENSPRIGRPLDTFDFCMCG